MIGFLYKNIVHSLLKAFFLIGMLTCPVAVAAFPMVLGSVPNVCPLVTLMAESGFGVWRIEVIHCGCSEMRHPWRWVD
jgi:hypothetical protein